MWYRTLFVLLLAPTLALAEPRGHDDAAFKARADYLWGWIAGKTDYKTWEMPLPPFLFLTPQEINYTSYMVNRGSWGGENNVTAMYVPLKSTGILVLPKDFQLGRDDWMLLHELVHHAQNLSGKKFQCAQNELEAYKLQSEWVRTTGQGRMADEFLMVMFQMGCEGR